MPTSRKERRKRMLALQALSAAVLAAALIQVTAQNGSAAPQRVARIPAGGAAETQPAPDVDNTGKPEDPAAAPNRDPGDLMNAGALVYVDDSFASVDKLRTAIRSASQGQSQLAIKQFQDITDHFGQKLVLLNDNSYVSITDFVRDRLLAMPAVKNGMYDQLFGADAKRDIDAAIENRDVSGLIRSSDRYYPSTAALKGLCQAAEWYFERGEFPAAAQTWRKALVHPQIGDLKPQILFSAGVAEGLAQDHAAAQATRDRLEKEFPDATGTVSGADVKLLTKLNEVLALPPWEKTEISADEWPAFEGGASRSRLLSTSATIGARLWGLSMRNSLSSGEIVTDPAMLQQLAIQQRMAILQAQQQGIMITGNMVSGDQGMLNSHPVISNGVLFIHSGAQIIALSVNAGAKLWSYPPDASSIDVESAQFIRSNVRSSSHDSACVYGDQIFAVLPARTPNQAAGISYVNGMAMMPTRIVCLNRDDGTQTWSRLASEVKIEKEGALTFVGSPLVTRQGVFVMARKLDNANFTQQFLVRLDRETGEPTWSCYLCSTNNQFIAGGLAAIPVPTLVDDIVYISTGQGADCAVDGNAGRILWLRPTATTPPPGSFGGGGFRSNIPIVQLLPSWKFNPPVVIGDNLLTTDNGQVLRIYNRWSGRLIKSIPAMELASGTSAPPSIDVLAGAIGTKVIMSLSDVSVCYDIASLLDKNPQAYWQARITGAGAPLGRPFLTATGYYVPFASKLVRVDTRSGKSDQWDWPKNDKDENGKPGNLLVTSEQVIVVNDIEVAGYSKWETARDNRLAKIAANPKDPEPSLELAEIGFRTNNTDVAQNYMKQAVDLANTGAATAGQSNADFLGRLYRTNLAFAEQLFSKKDGALWGQARFYFEQCRATARLPEQQAEWRMRLADLSREEKKPEEAAALYTEVLTDPALRAAAYARMNQNAGTAAEQQIADTIKHDGGEAFKQIESQAAAATQRAMTAHDTAMLQQVVDGYPNSTSAVTAATSLAALYQEKHEWENARRVLQWLYPRVTGNAQAKVIGNLATVCLNIGKVVTARSWADRGLSNYKDFTWAENGKNVSFSDLRSRIVQVGGAEVDGRIPDFQVSAPAAIELGGDNSKALIAMLEPIARENQQLLAPIETSPALRQSNLLFVRAAGQLSIRDMSTGAVIKDGIALPRNADTVLLGATRDNAILLQQDCIIGLDLKSFETWTVTLKNAAPPRPAPRPVVQGGRIVRIAAGTPVQVLDGNVIINGNNYGPAETVNLQDENGNPYQFNPTSTDPDALRREAFNILGNQMRFTSAAMLNGKVYILAGNEVSAYDVKSGKPAWAAPGGTAAASSLPAGTPSCLIGNEDLILVQVDAAAGKSTTFCALDAETGKQRKLLSLNNQHVLWRGLGDDGVLYVVTDLLPAAYDLNSTINEALWHGSDPCSHFAAATILTPDGLMIVTDNMAVQSLSLSNGANRFGSPPSLLDTNFPIPGNAALRSTLDGKQVIFQSADASEAFNSADGQLNWVAAKVPAIARRSLQLGRNVVVEMLQDPLGKRPTLGTNFVIRGESGGKMYLDQPLLPLNINLQVRNWQVLDHAIAFEVVPSNGNTDGGNVTGQVYLWKTTAQPPKDAKP